MTITFNDNGSDERYGQSDLLAVVVSILPKQHDPTEFLKELNKFLGLIGLNREVQQTKAETEAEACNRLIAITLKYAKRQGVCPHELPNLKRKSYDQLCAYIKEYWPNLVASI